MINLGSTRLEIGVQALDDHIYRLVNRGHTVKDVVEATQLAKDSGLKVCYHMMPGLPGSTPEKDLETYIRLFEDERFMPDMIKIYPTLVVEGSELADWWLKGKYNTYPYEELVQLLVKMKAATPEWARIMRLQRDVPSKYILSGCRFTNLREIVQREMDEQGLKCRCIRCREIGHNRRSRPSSVKLKTTEYRASGGTEYFLQYVTRSGVLLAMLRFRIPHRPFRKELMGCGIVRELRVFGKSVPVGQRSPSALQHKGLGKQLLEAAEQICRNENIGKIAVNSGVGVREYYRKLGYELDDMYMGKEI
jgi:elongator complex protein 3